MELNPLIFPIETAENSIQIDTSPRGKYGLMLPDQIPNGQKVVDPRHPSYGGLHMIHPFFQINLVHIGDSHGLTKGDRHRHSHFL